MLYHITTNTLWAEAQQLGYVAIPNPSERFIHCSWRHQVLRVAEMFFSGQQDLILLCIDPTSVAADLVEEDLYDAGELFPHVYGPVRLTAVRSAQPFRPDEQGVFHLPPRSQEES